MVSDPADEVWVFWKEFSCAVLSASTPSVPASCAFHFLVLSSTIISDTLAGPFVLRDLRRFPLSSVSVSNFFMISYLLRVGLYANLSTLHI